MSPEKRYRRNMKSSPDADRRRYSWTMRFHRPYTHRDGEVKNLPILHYFRLEVQQKSSLGMVQTSLTLLWQVMELETRHNLLPLSAYGV